jgi:hypothetical protein
MLVSRVICQTNWNTRFYVVFQSIISHGWQATGSQSPLLILLQCRQGNMRFWGGIQYSGFSNGVRYVPSGKNMWRHHTIRCDHTISKKWTFVHTEISFDHTINIWSHRKKFVHTINLQDHTVIILFTPCTCWSHSWNFCSHHLNFVHTINFQDHTVIILFTPWRCWSHSWKFCSHHLNFVHTIVY